MSRIPLLSSNILDPVSGAKFWNCEPMKYCDNRTSRVFCGEVLGGGSRVNSMVYHRGSAADYDHWAAMGHPEWSFEKVLPYFRRSEASMEETSTEYHGDSGTGSMRSRSIILRS